MNTRRIYTSEFKIEAVKLAKERGNLSATARDLGISGQLLTKWKQQSNLPTSNPFPGHGNVGDELTRANRVIARLEAELEVLKKTIGIVTRPPQ